MKEGNVIAPYNFKKVPNLNILSEFWQIMFCCGCAALDPAKCCHAAQKPHYVGWPTLYVYSQTWEMRTLKGLVQSV